MTSPPFPVAQILEPLEHGIDADGLRASMALSRATSSRIFFDAASRRRISASARTSMMRVSAAALASLRLFAQRGGFGFGNFEHVQIAARNLEDQQVAEMVEQIGKQPAQIFAVFGQVVQLAQRRFDFAVQHGAGEFQQLALRGQAEHREHVGFFDLVAAKADELVEGGFGVAHAAFGAAGDGVERCGCRSSLSPFRRSA